MRGRAAAFVIVTVLGVGCGGADPAAAPSPSPDVVETATALPLPTASAPPTPSETETASEAAAPTGDPVVAGVHAFLDAYREFLLTQDITPLYGIAEKKFRLEFENEVLPELEKLGTVEPFEYGGVEILVEDVDTVRNSATAVACYTTDRDIATVDEDGNVTHVIFDSSLVGGFRANMAVAGDGQRWIMLGQAPLDAGEIDELCAGVSPSP